MTMRVLVIVNDQPYGSERPYNALRLAGSLAKREDVELRVFLLGDAVACAVAGQTLPDGHYHLDRMLMPSYAQDRSAAAAPAWTRAASARSSSSMEHAAQRSRS
jgi:sulfur relay (sulfurtransferase) complex TusBCD TusD component (DsrE family)